MRLLRRLLHILLCAVFPSKASRPEDIPKKLPPEMLEKALAEARFLSGSHAVRVKELASDEVPGLPKRAD